MPVTIYSMTVTLPETEVQQLQQHKRRNELLTTISELSATGDTDDNPTSLLKECCRIILEKEEFCLV